MRLAVLGNGSLYLGFDDSCSLREVFWPVVGLQNHVSENSRNRIVLCFRGQFMEVGDAEWTVSGNYGDGMVFSWDLNHRRLPLTLKVKDLVDPFQSIWMRQVLPGWPKSENVGLYLRQAYSLNENTVGQGAFWDPHKGRMYHHKGETWMASCVRFGNRPAAAVLARVAKVRDGGVGVDESTGKISGPTIDHGSVESMIGITGKGFAPGDSLDWVTVFGRDRAQADRVMDLAQIQGVKGTFARSEAYWRSLPQEESVSLKVLLAHADDSGGILASCDTGVMGDFRDHYRYVWHRDAAMCASILAKTGFLGHAERYLEFSQRTLSSGGYQLQRYRPDGTLGSGWHLRDLPPGELPIQEDETALVLVTAGDYYSSGGSLDFLDSLYEGLIKKAAEFVTGYVRPGGLLCNPSYDLWEERRGIFSYTQASCVAGLYWASVIAKVLGKPDSRDFLQASLGLLEGLVTLLAQESHGYCRGISGIGDGGQHLWDWTDDSSLFLIPLLLRALRRSSFGEELMSRALGIAKVTWRRLRRSLAVQGGMARYTDDWYARERGAEGQPGNPWLVSTAWGLLSGLELGLLEKGEVKHELRWFEQAKLSSGIMPEQLSCVTLEPVSVAPLTWSHGTYLELKRLVDL